MPHILILCGLYEIKQWVFTTIYKNDLITVSLLTEVIKKVNVLTELSN